MMLPAIRIDSEKITKLTGDWNATTNSCIVPGCYQTPMPRMRSVRSSTAGASTTGPSCPSTNSITAPCITDQAWSSRLAIR